MNKTILLALINCMILILGISSCSKDDEINYSPVTPIDFDTVVFEKSMKGFELYSWPNGNDWNYSILLGTNRIKSLEEVKNNPLVVFGSDSLKLLLDKIPENESIFWIGKQWLGKAWDSTDISPLALPAETIINDIKEYCTSIQLSLTIDLHN